MLSRRRKLADKINHDAPPDAVLQAYGRRTRGLRMLRMIYAAVELDRGDRKRS